MVPDVYFYTLNFFFYYLGSYLTVHQFSSIKWQLTSEVVQPNWAHITENTSILFYVSIQEITWKSLYMQSLNRKWRGGFISNFFNLNP